MRVINEYLNYKIQNKINPNSFEGRVELQKFLRDRLEEIWKERPKFTNGGLLKNYMTHYALGFAYYDCTPTAFCKTRCYGLPISGIHDYYMLRLCVMTSESLKTEDPRFLKPLSDKIKNLQYLKIGHWGDAVPEQVPVLTKLIKQNPQTSFWWYTRKKVIAKVANENHLPNLKVYLSLDPSTEFPSYDDYPYGITYLFGDHQFHHNHDQILSDDRLIAIFPLKKGKSIEDPVNYGIALHPKICEEKRLLAERGSKGNEVCLSCNDRCKF